MAHLLKLTLGTYAPALAAALIIGAAVLGLTVSEVEAARKDNVARCTIEHSSGYGEPILVGGDDYFPGEGWGERSVTGITGSC